MRHPIDPKIDCVFKALLGSEENRDLLIHFLNAILGRDLPAPITRVEILSPFNEREFMTDKLSIVDVKARDDQGRFHQVEIQLLNVPDLPARILYAWTDLYSRQLQRGEDYGTLRATYAIWLLGEDLLRGDAAFAHRYRLRDDAGRSLLDHGGIYLFELKKFAAERVETEAERWLKFFKDGAHLDETRLPAWMQTAEMRQAMSTLKAFSDKERAYDAYQARENFLRQQRSIQRHLDEQQVLLEAAERQKEAAEREKEAAEREKEAAERGKAVAEQGKDAAEREKLAALQAQESERRAKEAALQAREAERQAKDAALAEVARLKALLRDQTPPADA